MGFISNLFGGRTTERVVTENEETVVSNDPAKDIAKEEEDVFMQTVIATDSMIESDERLMKIMNAEIETTAYAPNGEMILIAKHMEGIPLLKHLNKDAKAIAYDPNLQEESCKTLLLNVSQILKNIVEEIQSIADPMQMLYEFNRKCSQIAIHTCLAEGLNFENFLDTDTFVFIKDESELLKHFEIYLPEIYAITEPDFTKLKFDLIHANNSYNKLVSEIDSLKEEQKKLIEEITNYANTINTTKAKHRLSVDWNGKKQPLMALGQQLNVKRATFLESEDKINKSVALLQETYYELHHMFVNSCSYFMSQLEKSLDLQVPDDSFQTKKMELKEKYRVISSVEYKIEKFLSKSNFQS